MWPNRREHTHLSGTLVQPLPATALEDNSSLKSDNTMWTDPGVLSAPPSADI